MNTSAVRAIVTGAASGLGLAAATRLAANGAKVVIADLPNSNGAAEAAKIGAEFHPTDVTNADQVGSALDALSTFAGGEVNTVVNCAGVAIATRTYHPKKGVHSLEDFSKVLNVNTVGTFNVFRLAVERMANAEPSGEDGSRGVIVNTASIAAFEGQVGQVAYAASKGAIVGMTLPAARDLTKSGIRVNCIAPGMFKTPLLAGLPEEAMAKLEATVPCPSRLGNPVEFGMMVEQIINNGYFNGEVVRLDGALRMV